MTVGELIETITSTNVHAWQFVTATASAATLGWLYKRVNMVVLICAVVLGVGIAGHCTTNNSVKEFPNGITTQEKQSIGLMDSLSRSHGAFNMCVAYQESYESHQAMGTNGVIPLRELLALTGTNDRYYTHVEKKIWKNPEVEQWVEFFSMISMMISFIIGLAVGCDSGFFKSKTKKR